MKVKLTKRKIDSIKPPATGRAYYWDTAVTGFGLVVNERGVKTFVVRYGGRRRRHRVTIGPFGPLTVEAALEKAKGILGQVCLGGNPAADIAARKAMPTWSEWVKDYLALVVLRKRAPWVDRYHLQGNKGGSRKDAKPVASEAMRRWGSRPLDEITTNDVEELLRYTAEHGGPIHANREFASIRACLEAAVRADYLRANPAARVKKLPENPPRSRVLSEEEDERVRAAVAALPDARDRGLMMVLLDMGLRKSEALRARWEDLDLDRGLWTLPRPKSGKPEALPIPGRTIARLRELPQDGPWVFPSHRGASKKRVEVRDLWNDILTAARVEGVTLHDLRRTLGLSIGRREGILEASRVLRHSDIRVTARVYAPLGVEDLRKIIDDRAEEQGRLLDFPKAVGGEGDK